ncbi:MAG: hypothetical protein AB7F89_05290 [Pirellulaceae bacterium]
MLPFATDVLPDSPQVAEAPSLPVPFETRDKQDARTRPPTHLPIQSMPAAIDVTRDPSRSLYDVFA